jgi:toxin ParE1/3/4
MAEADIVDVLAWTYGQFGAQAALRYEHLIATGLRTIANDPNCTGTMKRPELGLDVCSYHLRYCRSAARHESGLVRHPRHILLFRPESMNVVAVGRLLFDGMELERHLPPDYRLK